MDEFTIFENNRLKPGNIIIIYMAITCLPLTFVTVVGFSTKFSLSRLLVYIQYADEPHGKQVIVA